MKERQSMKQQGDYVFCEWPQMGNSNARISENSDDYGSKDLLMTSSESQRGRQDIHKGKACTKTASFMTESEVKAASV